MKQKFELGSLSGFRDSRQNAKWAIQIFQWFELGWLLTLSFAILLPSLGARSMESFVRVIDKDFSIVPDGTTSIENRYGFVDIRAWNKDQVRVEVEIVVEAKSEAAAEKVFDRIDIHFHNTSSIVRAITQIESNTGWWSGWGTVWWGGSGASLLNNFEINYTVWVPPTNCIKVSNRYGDVQIAALEGDLSLSVKYGHFTVEGTTGRMDFELSYGNGRIMRAAHVVGRATYAKLRAKSLTVLRLESRYSKIHAEEAVHIMVSARYDDYEIGRAEVLDFSGNYSDVRVGQVRELMMVGRYTDLRVDTLEVRAVMDLQYGDVRVDKVAKAFATLELLGRYVDYQVQIAEGANYKVELQGNYVQMRLPPQFNCRKDIERYASRSVEGYVGTPEARSTIRADLNHGSVRIQ